MKNTSTALWESPKEMELAATFYRQPAENQNGMIGKNFLVTKKYKLVNSLGNLKEKTCLAPIRLRIVVHHL